MTSPKPSDTSSRSLSKALRLLLGACCIQALLCACDNGCEQVREAYMTTTFTSTSGRSLRSINLICLSDTLGFTATLSQFTDIELQLNPKGNHTTMILDCSYSDYGDFYTTSDTVEISYTVEPKFLDMECGCTVLFRIDDVSTTRHLISNVIINDNTVVADGESTHLLFEY